MLKHWSCMCTFVPFDSLVYFLSFHLGCNLPKLVMCTQGMKFFAFFLCRLADNPTWVSSCHTANVYVGCLLTVTEAQSTMTIVPFQTLGPSR